MTPSIETLAEVELLTEDKKIQQQSILEEILDSIQFPQKPDFLPFIKDNNYFNIITNQEELLEAFRLRFVAYSEAGYINPNNYPLGMEFDKYDAASVHFLARSLATGNTVGYVRLILDKP